MDLTFANTPLWQSLTVVDASRFRGTSRAVLLELRVFSIDHYLSGEAVLNKAIVPSRRPQLFGTDPELGRAKYATFPDSLPKRHNIIFCMNQAIQTRCCIAGGGPAGMMLGLLLARMGVDVFVLEKHADFLRDFRGDTIHPSTLEIMHELGILDEFLKRPHQEIRELAGQVGKDIVTIGDFTHLPTHCRFLALMPQWDFLNFIADQARRYPTFHLKMQAEVTGLIIENDAVAGVRAETPEGPLEIRAALTIGADGRHSLVRQRAGLDVINLGAPMDVMWMRISRRPSDPVQTFGHVDRGKILVLLNREDYWQCAFVIAKGTAGEIREEG